MTPGLVYARMVSPVGPLWMAATPKGLCAIGIGPNHPQALFTWLARHVSPQPPGEDPPALADATRQMREYFGRQRRQFNLPLDMHGTPFQQEVWTAVADVPYGTTVTYGQIAAQIGRPKAARAVGAANGANPLPIVIPCHRVIGAGGALTGYGGGLETKATLLRLEGFLLQ